MDGCRHSTEAHTSSAKTLNCPGRVAGGSAFALREVVSQPEHRRPGQRRKTVPAGSQADLCSHCEKSSVNRSTDVLDKDVKLVPAGSQADLCSHCEKSSVNRNTDVLDKDVKLSRQGRRRICVRTARGRQLTETQSGPQAVEFRYWP